MRRIVWDPMYCWYIDNQSPLSDAQLSPIIGWIVRRGRVLTDSGWGFVPVTYIPAPDCVGGVITVYAEADHEEESDTFRIVGARTKDVEGDEDA